MATFEVTISEQIVYRYEYTRAELTEITGHSFDGMTDAEVADLISRDTELEAALQDKGDVRSSDCHVVVTANEVCRHCDQVFNPAEPTGCAFAPCNDEFCDGTRQDCPRGTHEAEGRAE